MAYKSPKPGATTHSVKVELPLDILEKVDAFGKERGIITRNVAIIEALRVAVLPEAEKVEN